MPCRRSSMKRKDRLSPLAAIVLVTTLLFACAFARAEAAETEPASPNSQKYMFIDEVKPGMKGYGLTVFSGTKIERFDAEVVSVLYGTDPRSNLILVRISGGPIDKANVIAGMSGSPIYMDDRIIGALAYSWVFSKEPIAGITPIDEMLRIFEFEQGSASSATVGREETDSTGWAHAANVSVALPATMSESAVMKPVMTPMVFSGFSREAVEYFRPQLEGWGIIPVVGGSFSERLTETDAPFEEGAAVGVQLVRGDMSASAIGTLTVKEDGKLLAFGHPFMLAGPVDFPITTAYVHTVLPNLAVSTKVGTSLKSVGAMTQDRRTGIAGVLGGSSKMVPLTLRVKGAGQDQVQTYDFEIVRSRQMLPSMAGMALGGSFSQAAGSRGEFTAKIHYEIQLDGFPTISNDDFISGLSGFPTLASLGLFRDLSRLLSNQFEELSIQSISMDVEVQEAVESAQITGIRIHKDTLRPGEETELKIIMKPYMKDYMEKRFTLQVPEHFPEGQAYVQISAASQTAVFERMRSPFRFQPNSIEKLVELVDEDYPGNRMDIRLLVADPGIVIDGEEMPALPSSVFSVISQTMGREPMGITRASVLLERHIFMDFELDGSIIIPITIDRRAR